MTPTAFTLAMLGAIASGQGYGRTDARRHGTAAFKGAWGCAEEAGIVLANFETEKQFLAIRSCFTSGYLDVFNKHLVEANRG